jgi:uncharacterized protein (DUF1778 family)
MKSDKQTAAPTKDARITFRLTPEEDARLRELARARGVKPGTLVYQTVKRLLTRAA